jgi:putative transferase (TIGR04331 family)
MTKVARHLITTADERTWKFDRPVLFLGEWCRLYDRKQVWGGMDGIVAEPYGLQAGQKKRDFAYIQALSSQLLGEVTNQLNAFHNTHHSLRYWNIVLGHWLQRYVAITFNRYFTLEQCLKNYEISGTSVFDSADYHLATNDSLDFVWASNDMVWNHVLYTKILKFLGYLKTEKEFATLHGKKCFKQESNSENVLKISIKSLILSVVSDILPKFSRRNDAFIANSYLPLKEEIKLQLILGQSPQLWRSPILKTVAHAPEKHRRFRVDADNYQGFEKFVRSQLGEMIPACYLEGYEQLMQQAKTLPWPAEPRFIFTSNNFDTDEIFKVWTGSKVEEGFPYLTGQHGNNYGTHIYDGNSDWPERKSSNHFVTWGWIDESKNCIPAFIFKTTLKKQQQYNQQGGLLLVETVLCHMVYPYDTYHEYKTYQEEQFRFVEALPKKIKEELTVRLQNGWRSMNWSEDRRWKDRIPTVYLETGKAPMKKLISRSRLVVHTYDSTGILEGLALNIPTLCFWNGGLDHVLPSAKPYYELLRAAGILADTPEQAALTVARYWDNTDKWWKGEQVQKARRLFCEKYARAERHPVRTMKRLLMTSMLRKNN